MELTRDIWLQEDIIEFIEYLKKSFGNKEKEEWARNILNTQMPVLVIKTPDMKSIVKRISKGNFLSFLDFMPWEYYENAAIDGFLICLIKDFDVMKKYLDIYSAKVDNWANCDLLHFNVKNREETFLNLCLEYISSEKPFVRRIGMNILFNYINDDYIDRVLDLLDRFYDEEHYYVNMMNAWLFCECFIKQRDKTLAYLKNHHLNKFTINKGIQKCRDSYRVSDSDKEALLQYKMR